MWTEENTDKEIHQQTGTQRRKAIDSNAPLLYMWIVCWLETQNKHPSHITTFDIGGNSFFGCVILIKGGIV
jgi:hypothetical protein